MKVNNKVELNLHRWVDIDHDRIEIQSQTLRRESFRYVLLHKPAGVVTTNSDERAERTVFDVLGDLGKGLKAVGRLDKDTTGLLLFTNDHQLANRVTSPETGFSKTYVVRLDRPIRDSDLLVLSDGMEIGVGGREVMTRPARVSARQQSEIEISITEGKNRQVRKMLEELGYQVIALRRTAVGPLMLRDLGEGESREMTSEELSSLKSALGTKLTETHIRKPRSRYLGKNTKISRSFPASMETRKDHPKSRSRFQGKNSKSGKPAYGPSESKGAHPKSEDRYQGRRSRGAKSAFGSGDSKVTYPKPEDRYQGRRSRGAKGALGSGDSKATHPKSEDRFQGRRSRGAKGAFGSTGSKTTHPKSQSRFQRNKTGGSHRKSGR